MKTRDLVRAHIAGHRERFMREAVFHGRLLSDVQGEFVTRKRRAFGHCATEFTRRGGSLLPRRPILQQDHEWRYGHARHARAPFRRGFSRGALVTRSFGMHTTLLPTPLPDHVVLEDTFADHAAAELGAVAGHFFPGAQFCSSVIGEAASSSTVLIRKRPSAVTSYCVPNVASVPPP